MISSFNFSLVPLKRPTLMCLVALWACLRQYLAQEKARLNYRYGQWRDARVRQRWLLRQLSYRADIARDEAQAWNRARVVMTSRRDSTASGDSKHSSNHFREKGALDREQKENGKEMTVMFLHSNPNIRGEKAYMKVRWCNDCEYRDIDGWRDDNHCSKDTQMGLASKDCDKTTVIDVHSTKQARRTSDSDEEVEVDMKIQKNMYYLLNDENERHFVCQDTSCLCSRDDGEHNNANSPRNECAKRSLVQHLSEEGTANHLENTSVLSSQEHSHMNGLLESCLPQSNDEGPDELQSRHLDMMDASGSRDVPSSCIMVTPSYSSCSRSLPRHAALQYSCAHTGDTFSCYYETQPELHHNAQVQYYTQQLHDGQPKQYRHSQQDQIQIAGEVQQQKQQHQQQRQQQHVQYLLNPGSQQVEMQDYQQLSNYPHRSARGVQFPSSPLLGGEVMETAGLQHQSAVYYDPLLNRSVVTTATGKASREGCDRLVREGSAATNFITVVSAANTSSVTGNPDAPYVVYSSSPAFDHDNTADSSWCRLPANGGSSEVLCSQESGLNLLSPQHLTQRLSDNAQAREAVGGSDAELAQYLADERVALFLQNDEFMRELRANRDFMAALQREYEERVDDSDCVEERVGAGAGGGRSGGGAGACRGGWNKLGAVDDATLRARIATMGKASRKKFSQIARVFSRGGKRPGGGSGGGAVAVVGGRLVGLGGGGDGGMMEAAVAREGGAGTDHLLEAAHPLVEDENEQGDGEEEERVLDGVVIGSIDVAELKDELAPRSLPPPLSSSPRHER